MHQQEMMIQKHSSANGTERNSGLSDFEHPAGQAPQTTQAGHRQLTLRDLEKIHEVQNSENHAKTSRLERYTQQTNSTDTWSNKADPTSNPNRQPGFTRGTWFDRNTGISYMNDKQGNLFTIHDGPIEPVYPEAFLFSAVRYVRPLAQVLGMTKMLEKYGILNPGKRNLTTGDQENLINLYRVVKPEELEQILEKNIFTNPYGIENKYFSTNLEGAMQYALMAEKAFGDPPYTIIGTSISREQYSLLPADLKVSVDQGISAVLIPTHKLSLLSRPAIIDKPVISTTLNRSIENVTP